MTQWECFSDVGYFDMWCVRPVGSRTFGDGFHLIHQSEAERLRDYLNAIAIEARQGGDAASGSMRSTKARAEGIAHTPSGEDS